MNLSFDLDGLESVFVQMEAAHHQMSEVARQGALGAAQLALQYAREEVLSAHTSAPGGPPKSVSGALVASMVARAVAGGGAEFRVNSDHAKHVEFGTRKMQPFPYAGPAVQRAKQDFLNTLKAMVLVSVRFNVIG